MIAFLQGKLSEAEANRIVVDVGGVGYEACLSSHSFRRLPALGGQVRILTYQHVREDTLALYGFLSDKERDLFKLLLGVSGIGPKVAMNILSGITVEDFYRAVREADRLRLSGVPGVGKKTAERLLVELKDKVLVLAAASAKEMRGVISDAKYGGAMRALIALGYKQAQAQTAVEKVAKKMESKKASTEDFVKEALKLVEAG